MPMKKLILILMFFTVLHSSQAFASEFCFIAKENDKILKIEGDCSKRYAPESTFKIPLSLMGFDSGILKNESDPIWKFKEGYVDWRDAWKKDQTPQSWMKESCVWYSQVLTKQLGMEKFQDYVTKFSYGNMDLSGGLTNAWLSSSLQISPHEQTEFIQKVVDHKFPLSNESYDKTKNIMFIKEMAGGWKLYGKTGSGRQFDKDGNKTELQHGWFVGYIEKGSQHIVFASHIADARKEKTFASFRARNDALTKLWYLIDELEK
jgi:beta-lactamase class D